MMQDEKISAPQVDGYAPSVRTERLLARLAELWQLPHEVTFEELRRILVGLSEEEQVIAIEVIAEYLVSRMKLHFLDIVATFRQKVVEEEDISVQERDEAIQEAMSEAYQAIHKLSRQLSIKSMDDLVLLGNITFGLYIMSQITSAEQAERWMYKLSEMYRDRLEHEHLLTCDKVA